MEKLIGREFVLPKESMVDISEVRRASVILLLFSGMWCPPCINFLAYFKKFYREVNSNCRKGWKNVEAIYISCEESEEEFVDHFAELDIPSLPYEDSRIDRLKDLFEVEFIPVVVLLRKDGSVNCSPIRKMIQDEGADCLILFKKVRLSL